MLTFSVVKFLQWKRTVWQHGTAPHWKMATWEMLPILPHPMKTSKRFKKKKKLQLVLTDLEVHHTCVFGTRKQLGKRQIKHEFYVSAFAFSVTGCTCTFLCYTDAGKCLFACGLHVFCVCWYKDSACTRFVLCLVFAAWKGWSAGLVPPSPSLCKGGNRESSPASFVSFVEETSQPGGWG